MDRAAVVLAVPSLHEPAVAAQTDHRPHVIGIKTRFPSLTLAVNGFGRGLSWTGTGVAIPPEQSASDVFNQLFLQGTPEQAQAQIRKLDTDRSILDAIGEQAKDLERNLGERDRHRLEQYFTSVRDLEHRLQESKGWESRPKPAVNVAPPRDPGNVARYMAKVKAMYDLTKLTFETDSTRAVTLMLNSGGTPVITDAGLTLNDSYHNLSTTERPTRNCRSSRSSTMAI